MALRTTPGQQSGTIKPQDVVQSLTQQVAILTEQNAALGERVVTLTGQLATANARIADMEAEARIDSKTGLPNKAQLLEDLAKITLQILVPTANKKSQKIGRYEDFIVIYIDMRGLKRVNDDLSHDAGDKLIIDFFTTVSKNTKFGATYRLHSDGDEGAILVRGTFADAQKVVERVTQEISKLTVTGLPDFRVGMYAGFASLRESIREVAPLEDQATPQKGHVEEAREIAHAIATDVLDKADISMKTNTKLRGLKRDVR